MKIQKSLQPLLLVAILAIGCSRHEQNAQKNSELEEFCAALAKKDTTDVSRALYRFGLIIDQSGSMGDRDCVGAGTATFDRKMDAAHYAAAKFLLKVPSGSKVAVIAIGSGIGSVKVVSGFTNDYVGLLRKIYDLKPSGGTPLAEGMRAMTDSLKAERHRNFGNGTYRLIPVTDGIASGLEDASQYCLDAGIPVYAIGLCIEGEHPLRKFAIYTQAQDAEQLVKALEASAAESEVF